MEQKSKRQKIDPENTDFRIHFRSIVLLDNEFLEEELEKYSWALSKKEPLPNENTLCLPGYFKIQFLVLEDLRIIPCFYSQDHQNRWLNRIINLLTWSRYYEIPFSTGEYLLKRKCLLGKGDWRLFFSMVKRLPNGKNFIRPPTIPDEYVLSFHAGPRSITIHSQSLRGAPAFPIQNLLYYLCIQFNITISLWESLLNATHGEKSPFYWNSTNVPLYDEWPFKNPYEK